MFQKHLFYFTVIHIIVLNLFYASKFPRSFTYYLYQQQSNLNSTIINIKTFKIFSTSTTKPSPITSAHQTSSHQPSPKPTDLNERPQNAPKHPTNNKNPFYNTPTQLIHGRFACVAHQTLSDTRPQIHLPSHALIISTVLYYCVLFFNSVPTSSVPLMRIRAFAFALPATLSASVGAESKIRSRVPAIKHRRDVF